MTTTHKDNSKLYFRIGIGVIAIVYTLFSYLTPYQFDDITAKGWYLRCNDWDESFNWHAWYQACLDRRLADNGRLANILDYLLILWVPKWLFAVCTGIATAGMFLFITKLIQALTPTGRRLSDFSILAIVWGASMVFFPWRNTIMIADYSLNYIYSTALILWVFYIAVCCETHKPKVWQLFLYAILGIIAGTFHEGLSAPIFAGFGIYALIRRFRLPSAWWIVVSAFAVGTMFVLTAPGIYGRAAYEMTAFFPQVSFLVTTFIILPVPVLALAMTVISTAVPKLRQRTNAIFKKQIFIVAITGMLSASVLCYMLFAQPRYGWLPTILAMIILIPLVLDLLEWPRKHKRAVNIACGILFAMTCLVMANVLKWQAVYWRESPKIHALVEQTETGTVYYDIFPPELLPKTALYQPVRVTWVYKYQMFALSTADRAGRLFAIVPTVLKDMRLGENTVMTDSVRGLYLYKNTIIGDVSEYNYNTYEMEMKTSSGETYRFSPERYPFVSEDGDTLMYIRHTHPELQDEIVEAHWVE